MRLSISESLFYCTVRESVSSVLGIAAHARFCPALIFSFHSCDFGLPFNAAEIFCRVSGGIVRLVLL